MLADMAIQNEAARALVYQYAHGRRRSDTNIGHRGDGKCSPDTAMSVTTDASVLGERLHKDFPVEGFMRDAKINRLREDPAIPPRDRFSGKNQHYKRSAITAAAMITVGVYPDLLDDAAWWRPMISGLLILRPAHLRAGSS